MAGLFRSRSRVVAQQSLGGGGDRPGGAPRLTASSGPRLGCGRSRVDSRACGRHDDDRDRHADDRSKRYGPAALRSASRGRISQGARRTPSREPLESGVCGRRPSRIPGPCARGGRLLRTPGHGAASAGAHSYSSVSRTLRSCDCSLSTVSSNIKRSRGGRGTRRSRNGLAIASPSTLCRPHGRHWFSTRPPCRIRSTGAATNVGTIRSMHSRAPT